MNEESGIKNRAKGRGPSTFKLIDDSRRQHRVTDHAHRFGVEVLDLLQDDGKHVHTPTFVGVKDDGC